jgi:response regulator RpfG family c-di-GMP phosphodiesterase
MSCDYKQFAVLAGALALCLAGGLLIQDRFVSAHYASQSDPAAALATTPTTVTWPVQCLTFVWICALQASALWLLMNRMRGEQRRQEQRSEEESLLQAHELIRTRDAVILGLAKLAESRDTDTGHHLERIAHYCTTLATALRRLPAYRDQINAHFMRTIGLSSVLHDIGKVGIGDAILLKRDSLTPDERVKMQEHTVIGAACIRQIQRQIRTSNFLQMAHDIALCHHERWDGTGYPRGLAGNAIPLAARILSIVDVYDALSVDRCYRAALPHAQCVAYIRQGAGTQFDPELVKVFLTMERQFQEIARRFAEHHSAATTAAAADASASNSLPDELQPAETDELDIPALTA